MIRRLLLPLAALVLLAGCVSTGYSYRGGSGDYYHGRPSVDYRYYPSYYPYGYYGPYRYRYASPWGYRYYGYPYGYRHRYVYPRYPRHVERPRTDPTPDRSRSPWRDLDRLRNGQDGERSDGRYLRRNDPAAARPPRPAAPRIQAPAPRPAPVPAPAPARTRSGSGDGSAIGGMLRRTRDRSHKNPKP